MTITEFLLARIAEDEACASSVIPVGRPMENGAARWAEVGQAVGDRSGYVVTYGVGSSQCRAHIARHDPARVLAECEAKRRIVARHTPETAIHADHGGQDLITYCGHCGTILDDADCPDLRDLATSYADHPDYDPDWALDDTP